LDFSLSKQGMFLQ